jgi:hypothetical protein
MGLRLNGRLENVQRFLPDAKSITNTKMRIILSGIPVQEYSPGMSPENRWVHAGGEDNVHVIT